MLSKLMTRKVLLTALFMSLVTTDVFAVNFNTAGNLYTGIVTNVLNGEIGYVTAIGFVAMGVFFLFRSAGLAVLSLAAAVVFWNAEAILNGIGMIV